MIDLGKFISEEKLNILRTSGLHKVAAVMEMNKTGRSFADGEMTLAAAVQLLGERAYEKRAAYNKIAKGIKALGMLRSKIRE